MNTKGFNKQEAMFIGLLSALDSEWQKRDPSEFNPDAYLSLALLETSKLNSKRSAEIQRF